jgi:hypothetical protein
MKYKGNSPCTTKTHVEWSMRGLSRVRPARSALDVVGEQFPGALVEKTPGTGWPFQSPSTGVLIEQEAHGRDKSLYLDPKPTAASTHHHLDTKAWFPAAEQAQLQPFSAAMA